MQPTIFNTNTLVNEVKACIANEIVEKADNTFQI